MWYLDVNSLKTDFSILSSPFHVHSILKLAPVLSQKSEKMHLVRTCGRSALFRVKTSSLPTDSSRPLFNQIEIFFSCILTSHFNCTYFSLYTARATWMSPRDVAFWAKSFRRQLWNYVRTTTATFASQLIYTASLMTVPDAVTRAAQSLLFSSFVEK